MYKIQTLNKIAPVWQDILTSDSFTVSDQVENPDAMIVRSADMHSMEAPASLLCVGRAGAGVNNIPVSDYAAKGIVVFNTPGANANAVKELVLAGLLLSGRDVIGGISWVKGQKAEGDAVPKVVEKGKGQFVGPELKGKTLGVIGLGGIGGMVANVAINLGMEVLGYDPYISVDNAWRLSRKIQHVTSEEALLAQADYVTIHVPLTDATRGSMNAETLAAMKDGSVLLNFSRGEIVDDTALLSALESGHIRRYVTDFPNAALLDHPAIIAIPHLGASTPESENNCVDMVARQIRNYLENGEIIHSVNYPDCPLGPVSGNRLTVLHANVANMIGQVTSEVAKENINISSMVNRSKGEWAYTVLDMDDHLSDAGIARIASLEGIYRVRQITR